MGSTKKRGEQSASKKKASKKKRTRRRGIKIEPTSLTPAQVPLAALDGDIAALAQAVADDGGALIGAYREPLGGHALMLVSLPIERVEPTAFQRDVSDAHVRKLTRAMDKTKRFLDPLILVRQGGRYLAPNGNHRLTAMRELGATTIVGLLVPEPEVAYQILALNIEKAHNLRERALEVVRMYRDLSGTDRKETDMELEFEEPALVTLGFAYEERKRLSGGAYHPALKKVDTWVDERLAVAAEERRRRVGLLLELDDAVIEAVQRLKEQGLTSPYLKAFVVARVNPLRFIKGEPPSFDALVATMLKRALRLDAGKISAGDLAKSGGAADE